MARMSALVRETWARVCASRKFGTAMAARTAMIATTIRSSIRVNARLVMNGCLSPNEIRIAIALSLAGEIHALTDVNDLAKTYGSIAGVVGHGLIDDSNFGVIDARVPVSQPVVQEKIGADAVEEPANVLMTLPPNQFHVQRRV